MEIGTKLLPAPAESQSSHSTGTSSTPAAAETHPGHPLAGDQHSHPRPLAVLPALCRIKWAGAHIQGVLRKEMLGMKLQAKSVVLRRQIWAVNHQLRVFCQHSTEHIFAHLCRSATQSLQSNLPLGLETGFALYRLTAMFSSPEESSRKQVTITSLQKLM